MNIYAIIILTMIILSFILDAIADYLNINNLRTELPEEFKDTYNSETYIKSQNYLKFRLKNSSGAKKKKSLQSLLP